MASKNDDEECSPRTEVASDKSLCDRQPDSETGSEEKPGCSSIGNASAGPSTDETGSNGRDKSSSNEGKTSSAMSDSGSDDGQRARKRERREESDDSVSFPRRRSRPRNRRYRSRQSSESSSEEERVNAAGSSSSPVREPEESLSTDSSAIGDRILELVRNRYGDARALDSDDTWSMVDSDDSDNDLHSRIPQDLVDTDEEESEENLKYQKCLEKEKPKHKWSVTKEVLNRQLGARTQQQGPELFWQHCYSSLHCVKRLELMYKLNEHHGCVNAISFNRSGTRLASGSDDKKIIVWDWATGRSVISYNTGHTSNVFQAKFLPLSGDTHMVSCARDGQIRLAVLSSTGECRSTKRLAHHRKPANKISLFPDAPHTFLSCGEDALVMSIDVRSNDPENLLYVKEDGKKVGLYSVDNNPLNKNEFCVCGMDPFIRIYDRRNLKDAPLKKFCPHHIVGSRGRYTTVTCALYSHDGTEILGSYSDENVYLFDAHHTDGADFVHKYEGHRNNATVKSCNFFGPNSEYVISGSDCGNIFFWDKNTEAIVQFMRGDEKGVVNALVGHPQIPILATCGLDHDVKIWVPSCEQDPEMKDLRKVVINNVRSRMENRSETVDIIERHHLNWGNAMRLISLRQVGIGEQLRARFMEPGSRRRSGRATSESSDSSDSDGYSSSRVQCPPS